MTRALVFALALGLCAVASHAGAADLYKPGAWSSLASDRLANRVGDSLTVIIDESSVATNSAQGSAAKGTSFGSQGALNSHNFSAQLGLNNNFTGAGQTGRSGKMVAQISVVIDQVLPNGDLHVAGEQTLDVDGERIRINVKGRVRPADISGANTVLSTRIADASITYGGKGFFSKSARPGIVNRILGWFGL